MDRPGVTERGAKLPSADALHRMRVTPGVDETSRVERVKTGGLYQFRGGRPWPPSRHPRLEWRSFGCPVRLSFLGQSPPARAESVGPPKRSWLPLRAHRPFHRFPHGCSHPSACRVIDIKQLIRLCEILRYPRRLRRAAGRSAAGACGQAPCDAHRRRPGWRCHHLRAGDPADGRRCRCAGTARRRDRLGRRAAAPEQWALEPDQARGLALELLTELD
jgi:hypothetical protein